MEHEHERYTSLYEPTIIDVENCCISMPEDKRPGGVNQDPLLHDDEFATNIGVEDELLERHMIGT